MNNMKCTTGHRILVIDDNEAIHEDFRKILLPSQAAERELDAAESLLFGAADAGVPSFDVQSSFQGKDGLQRLQQAQADGEPFSMAFVDVRMPPGWDGIETSLQLWSADPDLQIVLCTAYSDYSWREIVRRLGESDRFVILKKPFDNIEVLQLAHALCAKRNVIAAEAAIQADLREEIARRERTERELQAALDAAEQSNRCKRGFLATMSHELRTPLNAIIGYSEMLTEDAAHVPSADLIPGLEKIRKAGRHLLDIINDILDMSRIESGGMPVEFRRVSAADLARRVIEIAEPLARRNSNRLELEIEDESLSLDIDDTRFRQSLLNLVGNACKFTACGTVTLEVARGEDAGRECLLWRVRDTGIGIPQDRIESLFRPFAQVDSAVTRRYGGSGLGLAISQRLCEMMGGRITVESRLGEGSVFTICMPANHAAGEQPDQTAGDVLLEGCAAGEEISGATNTQTARR